MYLLKGWKPWVHSRNYNSIQGKPLIFIWTFLQPDIFEDLYTVPGVAECPELEELNISRNCLQTFSGMQHCTSLIKVDLSYNSITHLSDISSLTLLKVIDVKLLVSVWWHCNGIPCSKMLWYNIYLWAMWSTILTSK